MSILKNLIPSCGTTFSDADYRNQALQTLDHFMPIDQSE
jgi:hypothetical protein